MKAIYITINDLKRLFKNAFAPGMIFIAPLLITGIFYFAFTNFFDKSEVIYRLGIVNLDSPKPELRAYNLGNVLEKVFLEKPNNTPYKALKIETEKEMLDLLSGKKIDAGLLFLPDLTNAIFLSEKQENIIIYYDPSQTIAAKIIEEILTLSGDGFYGNILFLEQQQKEQSVRDTTETNVKTPTDYSQWFKKAVSVPGLYMKEIAVDKQNDDKEDSIKRIISDVMIGLMIFFVFFTGFHCADGITRNRVNHVCKYLVNSLEKNFSIIHIIPEHTQFDIKEIMEKKQLSLLVDIPEDWGNTKLKEQPGLLLYTRQKQPAADFIIHKLNRILLRITGSLKIAQQSSFHTEIEDVFKTVILRWDDFKLPIRCIPYQKTTDEEIIPDGFNQSSPGMLIQFAIMGIMFTALAFINERTDGTLNRLMLTPHHKIQIILGKLLGFLFIVILQQYILIILGQLVFQVHYFRNPLSLFFLIFSFSLFISILGLLISASVKKKEQAIIITFILMIFLSAFGGAWFPLNILGTTFTTAAKIFPSYWAMRGFQDIILKGAGLRSIVLPVAVILGYSALFTPILIRRLRKI